MVTIFLRAPTAGELNLIHSTVNAEIALFSRSVVLIILANSRRCSVDKLAACLVALFMFIELGAAIWI
jgi:hypothetical protein